MQPELVIIGAQKSGTSALFKILSNHPQVLPPTEKELDFFSSNEDYTKGISFYLNHFPRKRFRPLRRITFEASPAYLWYAERSAPRIAHDFPKMLCVAILRDPVKRAYSAWNMYRDFLHDPKRAHLHDPRTFAQAVDDELAGRTQHQYHKYLARGHYAEQLTKYYNNFPREQVQVYSYLHLKKQPETMVNEILNILRLPNMPKEVDLLNIRVNVRSYPEKMDRGLTAELYQYFAPEMQRLRMVLGHDLEILEHA